MAIEEVHKKDAAGANAAGWVNYDSELEKLTAERKKYAESLEAQATGGTKGLSTTAVTGNEQGQFDGNNDGAMSRNNSGDSFIAEAQKDAPKELAKATNSSGVSTEEIKNNMAWRKQQGDGMLRSLRPPDRFIG